MLKGIKTNKSLSGAEKKSLVEKYPGVDTAKCHCPEHHVAGCGYISDKFITIARSRFFGALADAGTEPEKYIACMTALHHHARDEHEWQDGQQCDFHSFRLCSCGECDEDHLKCEGKAYKTRHVLTRPFHRGCHSSCAW